MFKNYEKNKHQISRKDNKTTFVESLNTYFPIGRCLFRFIRYDNSKPEGKKQTDVISISPTFEEFERIYFDFFVSKQTIKLIESQHKEIQANKDNKNSAMPKPIILNQGGFFDKEKNSNMARLLKIGKANKTEPGKYYFLLNAEQGPAKKSNTGLYIPAFNGKPDNAVMMVLESKDIKELLLITKTHVDNFISAFYSTHYNEIYPFKDNKETEK